jgi:hypothetical protein
MNREFLLACFAGGSLCGACRDGRLLALNALCNARFRRRTVVTRVVVPLSQRSHPRSTPDGAQCSPWGPDLSSLYRKHSDDKTPAYSGPSFRQKVPPPGMVERGVVIRVSLRKSSTASLQLWTAL